MTENTASTMTAVEYSSVLTGLGRYVNDRLTGDLGDVKATPELTSTALKVGRDIYGAFEALLHGADASPLNCSIHEFDWLRGLQELIEARLDHLEHVAETNPENAFITLPSTYALIDVLTCVSRDLHGAARQIDEQARLDVAIRCRLNEYGTNRISEGGKVIVTNRLAPITV